MEELSRAYEDGLVDANSIDWQDLERALALGPRGALNARSWMGTSFPYWEGPISFRGSHSGVGYLEMTGY